MQSLSNTFEILDHKSGAPLEPSYRIIFMTWEGPHGREWGTLVSYITSSGKLCTYMSGRSRNEAFARGIFERHSSF